MSKLLKELNRTGHECFGYRPEPYMCNLKYAEDGTSDIIPYRYKYADAADTARRLGDTWGAQADALEQQKRVLEAQKAIRDMTVPKEPPKVEKNPIEKAVEKPGIPSSIKLDDTPSTTPLSSSKPELPAFADPKYKPMVTPPPAKPEAPKAPETLTPLGDKKKPGVHPSTLPPSEKDPSHLGFRPKMTQQGLRLVGPGENGAAEVEMTPEEFEEKYGKWYPNKLISTGQRCDENQWWGQVGGVQDVGFDSQGKLKTWVTIPGPNGPVKHEVDEYGNMIQPLSHSDGLIPFSKEERASGMALCGWYKTQNGLYVNAHSGEVVNKQQYMMMLENPNAVTMKDLQPNFQATITVDEKSMAQGVWSGINLVQAMDEKTGKPTWFAFSQFLKDKDGNPKMIPLGEKYRSIFTLGMSSYRYSSDFGGVEAGPLANRNYNPNDPTGTGTIPLMTGTAIFTQLQTEHPELMTVPQYFTVDEHGRANAVYTDAKGNTTSIRCPDSASNLLPTTACDFGYRVATEEECKKYGCKAGTLLHMTQDAYGNRKVEAQDAAGNKFGVVDQTKHTNEDPLGGRFYPNMENQYTDSSDIWSNVLKYVLMGLPVGLALGLVGWGLTGGKGSLSSYLLGGAGLGGTLGGLGAYTGLLGGGGGDYGYSDDYGYGSAMNAGY